MILRQDFGCCTGIHRRGNSKAKAIYPSFSRIYGRRYLIIGLVRGPDTHVNADENNRWHSEENSALKSIS